MKDKALREHVVSLLSGGKAHIDWKGTFKGVSPKFRGVRPEGLPYSVWDLLEHMRLAQWDILEFSRDAKHVSPEWPVRATLAGRANQSKRKGFLGQQPEIDRLNGILRR